MAPRKRRADASDDDSQVQTQARRQRQRTDSPADMPDSGEDAPSSMDAMVKKMVRLALACEYARIPIRRADISAKVLGEQGSRQFKDVFPMAQRVLRQRFGMEMTELPAKDNVSLAQRRAAQKTARPSTSNKSWVLSTTLPHKFRDPAILTPAKAPSTSLESTYTGLYTFIVAVIQLNGGALAESKLERYLARMNADQYTPIDKTDALLQRLVREGYLIRNREVDSGEEIIEYLVGPRGKVEVGTGSVADLVREVYGYGPEAPSDTNGNGEEGTSQMPAARREFEMRLRRTLGMPELREREKTEEPRAERGSRGASQGPRRSSRRTAQPESEDEDEDEDESEDEDDDDDESRDDSD